MRITKRATYCPLGVEEKIIYNTIMKERKRRRPGRPRTSRRINFSPRVYYFKPQGVPLRHLSSVELTVEEVEAIRLKYTEKLEQKECAERMNTSQSTFQRLLNGANEKISSAIIDGHAIKILKQNQSNVS